MQMRSRALMAEGAQALQRLAGAGTSPLRMERVAALYGSALASSMLNEHAAAEAQVAQALQLEATISPREAQAERALRLLQAEARLAAGKPAAALLALDALPASTHGASGERPPLLLRAQVALALRRADPNTPPDALRASTEALQIWLADAPHDAAAWELLASTNEVLGLKLRAMRAAAEARVVLGDLTGAIDRLRAAQGASRTAVGQDFIEASVIDARLRQVSAQRRQLALEARGEGRSSRPGPDDEPLP
jgi:predicted Zn-dependent protease